MTVLRRSSPQTSASSSQGLIDGGKPPPVKPTIPEPARPVLGEVHGLNFTCAPAVIANSPANTTVTPSTRRVVLLASVCSILRRKPASPARPVAHKHQRLRFRCHTTTTPRRPGRSIDDCKVSVLDSSGIRDRRTKGWIYRHRRSVEQRQRRRAQRPGQRHRVHADQASQRDVRAIPRKAVRIQSAKVSVAPLRPSSARKS